MLCGTTHVRANLHRERLRSNADNHDVLRVVPGEITRLLAAAALEVPQNYGDTIGGWEENLPDGWFAEDGGKRSVRHEHSQRDQS